MTEILLIKPAGPKKYYPCPSLGLGYLASMLKEDGITSVKVLNLEIDYMEDDEFAEYVRSEDPHVVGFSCMTCNYPQGLQFAALVKKAKPDAVTVFGGVHPTFQAEDIIKQHGDIVDIVVRREGEYSFRDVVQRLKRRESLSTVEGITYSADGKIIETPERPFIQNLDALPHPERDVMETKRYQESVRGCLITSRGCPWRCLYCSTSRFHGHKYRSHSPTYVVDEMQILVEEYDCKRVGIEDDLFTLDRKRVLNICDMILERNLKMGWGCSVRADTFDRELLEKMHEAGCDQLFIGVETVDDDVMKHIQKGLNVERVKDAIMLAKEIGFGIKASFILGLPFQKPEEGEAILKFAEEVGLEPPSDFVTVNLLCPFPGTDLYENPEKHGITITNENWTAYNGLNCVIESKTFPKDLLIDSYVQIMGSNFERLKWGDIEYRGKDMWTK